MLSVSIDPINGAMSLTGRQGNVLLLQLNVQWVYYGVSHVQKEKACRYVHTLIFMTMQLSLSIFILNKYSNLLHVQVDSEFKCLFPILSLGLLCSPFAI